MALQVTGKIEKIGDVLAIPSKDGQRSFNKREVVLDLTTYDRFTGIPRENHVLFEFGGNKCDLMNSFKVGDLVTVSFILTGRNYTPEGGTQKTFNTIVGYDCVLYKTQPNVEVVQNEVVMTQPMKVEESEENGDLPF